MIDQTSFEALSRYTKALSVALHERDRYTRFHCERVDRLVCELGAAFGLSEDDLVMLRISATLHDLGKIGIPDRTLLKPGALNAQEWAEMKTHSVRGELIVCATLLPNAQRVGTIIRHHHERFDGAGYPDALAGDQVPLLSRILSIADSYDAMATPRVYHRAKTHPQIMAVLHSEAGSKFDPALVDTFTTVIAVSACRVGPSG